MQLPQLEGALVASNPFGWYRAAPPPQGSYRGGVTTGQRKLRSLGHFGHDEKRTLLKRTIAFPNGAPRPTFVGRTTLSDDEGPLVSQATAAWRISCGPTRWPYQIAPAPFVVRAFGRS